jgi:ABC-type nitrate/sulfonate/bicarbonate transport system ATPase subunit
MSLHHPTDAALTVHEVSKTFPDRSGNVEALRGVSFSIGLGEFYSVVGPSGCGKSTLLNIIAGLEPEDTGQISVDPPSAVTDQTSVGPLSTPESRLGRVAYMPQKDLLLPWRTVRQNAALGLELTGVKASIAHERADVLLQQFGLAGFADAYPATLSGGMRQRTAFLRTVLTDRPVMLLDEPFGALDALTRRSMQEWLLDVWSQMQRTVLLITHDVDEAIFLSDRVAVMSQRPGTLISEHPVDLPRPRTTDMITDPAFMEIKRAVLGDLQSSVSEIQHAPQ